MDSYQLQDETAVKMLNAIFRETKGDLNRTAGMWAVGESIGLDRNMTQDVAMNLVGEGLLEIKSLSGGLALTPEGLEFLGGVKGQEESPPDLAGFLDLAEGSLGRLGLAGKSLQDLKADLATLQAQLKRSEPLPDVVRAVLASVQRALAKSAAPEAESLAETIKAMSR